MKKLVYILGILAAFVLVPLWAQTPESSPAAVFDKNFMRILSSTRVIERDLIFEKSLNKIVRGWGVIISSEKKNRYKRNFRFILEDKMGSAYKMNIKYHVYFNNEETAAVLSEGDEFEFRGQLMSYSAVNTAKSAYIVDVVLEEGTLIFE